MGHQPEESRRREITLSEDFILKFVQAINSGREPSNQIRITLLEIQMAKLTEAQAKAQETIVATQNAVNRVVEDNTAQNVEIQRLKDLIAAGGSITEADLDGLVTANQKVIDMMNALDPIPNPVPTPIP